MSNSAIIRQLKRLDKNNKEEDKSKGTKNTIANLFSFVALLVSITAIYFQFFYERYSLNASLIDATIYSDSLSFNLIYHNKGNQDATIIKSELIFYNDVDKSKEAMHINFVSEPQEPYILPPGKQIFKVVKQKVYFDDPQIKTNY